MLGNSDNHDCDRENVMSVLSNKPVRAPRQDVRTLPTYTIPEAAVCLGINRWTLAEWYDDSSIEPILKPSGTYLEKGNIKLLSFRDLEEAYKVHLLRTKHGKSMQYIQKALADARKVSGSDHPLLEHKMIVFDKLALEKPAKGKASRQMIPLGGIAQMPLYIPEVLDTWGKRILEDSQGRAMQIFPWKHADVDDSSKPVSINANVLSGRLVVTGTRVPVDVLLGYHESGRTVEDIAKLYRLEVDVVRKALQHVEPQQKVS